MEFPLQAIEPVALAVTVGFKTTLCVNWVDCEHELLYVAITV